jgi:hypothetical protein
MRRCAARSRAAGNDFRRFCNANGGAFRVAVIGPWNAADLITRAFSGKDPEAEAMMLGSAAMIREEVSWREGRRLCAVCDHVFTRLPTAFVLLLPWQLTGDEVGAMGLCDECIGRGEAAVWGDLTKLLRGRIVDITQGGRA